MLIRPAPTTQHGDGRPRATSEQAVRSPGYIHPVQRERLGDLGPARVDRALELLAELVAMPTESRTSNRELIEWVADHLRTFGAAVAIIDGDPGRANLLATAGPDGPGGLLLSGHTDVVAAGDGWATPAYALTEVDLDAGRSVAGRGTADMKGFIACVLATIEVIDASALVRPVHIALSYDEEVGCVGVRSLLDQLADGERHRTVRPDLVMIGEPTLMRPRHAHLGKVAYRLAFTAQAAHSSLSPFLPSAIGATSRVIAALESVARPHRATAIRDASGEPSADVSVNVGTIHGGTALNVLAKRCEMTFELRHTTAFDPDGLLAPVWAAVDEERLALVDVGGGIVIEEITRYPALMTDRSAAVVAVVERLADRGQSVPVGFGTEGGLFAAAIDAPVVICGPGDIGVAHRPDEHVSIEQLQACLTFLPRLIDALCR
ncbi:MAG: argE [Acidimicrobiales bacterium]|nr:argE [Acidimicrobiales bacterium]